jgi:predicted dehydrogenase
LSGTLTLPTSARGRRWCSDRAYQADSANGADLVTITGGHTIDALCHCLGEFRELAAFVASQHDRIPLEETGELIAKTSPDQLVLNGIVGGGAVVSFQIRGGMNRGTAFLFRDPRRRGRSPAHRHLTRLYAAAGTECERSAR